MSELRRRIFGVGTPDSTPDVSRDPSPAPPRRSDGTPDENYKVVAAEKLEQLRKKAHQKGRKRRNAWIFGLGGLFGIFIAGFFASNNGSLDRLVEVAGLQDMNLESLLDVLPTGLIRDIQDMQVCRACPLPGKEQSHAARPFVKLMLTSGLVTREGCRQL